MEAVKSHWFWKQESNEWGARKIKQGCKFSQPLRKGPTKFFSAKFRAKFHRGYKISQPLRNFLASFAFEHWISQLLKISTTCKNKHRKIHKKQEDELKNKLKENLG